MLMQMTRIAAERSAEKRLEYSTRIGQYAAHQLVFVDESSVDHRTTYRGFAWSIRGTAAQRKAFFVLGQRYVIKSNYCLHNVCANILKVFCTSGALPKRWYHPL